MLLMRMITSVSGGAKRISSAKPGEAGEARTKQKTNETTALPHHNHNSQYHTASLEGFVFVALQ